MNDLVQLLLISLITSLQIVFVHILFWPGMLFEFMRENKLPSLIQKPLYDCVICMTSFWGTLLWVFEWQTTVQFFPFLFTVGGISVLISGIIGRAEDINGEMFVELNRKKKITADYKKTFGD